MAKRKKDPPESVPIRSFDRMSTIVNVGERLEEEPDKYTHKYAKYGGKPVSMLTAQNSWRRNLEDTVPQDIHPFSQPAGAEMMEVDDPKSQHDATKWDTDLLAQLALLAQLTKRRSGRARHLLMDAVRERCEVGGGGGRFELQSDDVKKAIENQNEAWRQYKESPEFQDMRATRSAIAKERQAKQKLLKRALNNGTYRPEAWVDYRSKIKTPRFTIPPITTLPPTIPLPSPATLPLSTVPPARTTFTLSVRGGKETTTQHHDTNSQVIDEKEVAKREKQLLKSSLNETSSTSEDMALDEPQLGLPSLTLPVRGGKSTQ